ncbi:MAG: ABC transporter permease subunit [Treponema sp.]|jgi:multiple sugar transport system permease protein/putative aldouronate transport system permease protein|nr:ABC transporter permease subunit [Treponema sp.]
MKQKTPNPSLPNHRTGLWRAVWNVRGLYLLAAIPITYVIIFNYVPMYGVFMAFKRFQPRLGVWGSPWVGLYHFRRLFSSPNFYSTLRNTLTLSIYGLIAGFPFPIIMALCINHFILKRFSKIVQTVTFAPHFLSAVILVGFIAQVLSLRIGIVNTILKNLGLEQINFLGKPEIFPHVYVWSGIWQNAGYSAIIYISSLVAVDPNLHEAAVIDGANLWQRIWYIDLATIRPIIVIMLILSMGGILGTNFEKAYLLQNPLNIETSEVISTYVYKVGLASSRPDYSFGTAIGLFQNVIGVILTLTVNKIANLLTGEGMF